MESDPKTARDAYECWHSQQEMDHGADAPWHRLVKKHLHPTRDLAGRTLLEIGCGRGGFACWLAAHQASPNRVVAADFSTTAVQKGRTFAAGTPSWPIEWIVMDIQAIAGVDAGFDTVISTETIEHVPDPRRAIRELARVLKPGGRLFLSAPNYLGYLGLYRIALRLRGRRFTEAGQPINNFLLLPRTRAWVARAGLRVTATDAVGYYLPFPRRPPPGIEIHEVVAALRRRLAVWNGPPAGLNPGPFSRVRHCVRWFGLYSLIVAEKPVPVSGSPR